MQNFHVPDICGNEPHAELENKNAEGNQVPHKSRNSAGLMMMGKLPVQF